MHIGGRFQASADGRFHPTYDPASGELIANVALSSASDVDEAVANSKEGFQKRWCCVAPADRARLLNKIATLIRRDAQALATVESIDSGKPLREALGDVETSARYFEYYAGIADKLQGVSIPLNQGQL